MPFPVGIAHIMATVQLRTANITKLKVVRMMLLYVSHREGLTQKVKQGTYEGRGEHNTGLAEQKFGRYEGEIDRLSGETVTDLTSGRPLQISTVARSSQNFERPYLS